MDKLLTADEVADILGVPLATVYQWRSRSVGPRGYRVGRHLRFREIDVEMWLETQHEPRPAA